MDATVAQRRQLEAAIGGDATAFEALATESRAMIWSVCLRITGNTYDAEDALQSTLLAAWRGIQQFRREYSFGTWIYRIAATAALAVVKSKGTKPLEVDESYSPERDFAEHLAEADLVQRTLNSMPTELRVALVLRELCDYTYAQIADYQGVGVPVVKSRIARGRQAFEAAITSGNS
ncbi:RNA polymerase sigma factor [Pseudarthrobacter sp. NamE2]|uniref:RNA polymerase sigma factor n=1 Tax=Pseudarthrobacter sp. NamE2 TaxID=2576838 RepID=UPI0010FE89CF|nr:RNA polymerase sigma factor [Pseudarthrobacter sp. NamE2]TLM82962.1 RNA polymerase sigma factor [Pseudarthrobacter sp. NamE2]